MEAEVIDLSEIENQDVQEQEEEDMPQEQPESEPIELSEERAKKILTLEFYMREFPDKLAGYKDIPLHKLHEEQLDQLKSEFSFVVNAQSSINHTVTTFQQGMYFLEGLLVNHTPIKAQGLSKLINDPLLLSDVKAWSLENMEVIKSKPEHRIGMRIFASIVTLHNVNSQQAEVNNLKDINKKYDDL